MSVTAKWVCVCQVVMTEEKPHQCDIYIPTVVYQLLLGVCVCMSSSWTEEKPRQCDIYIPPCSVWALEYQAISDFNIFMVVL